MNTYLIETRGDAREVYRVTAFSEEEAREKWEHGLVTQTAVLEVTGAEIVSVEQED